MSVLVSARLKFRIASSLAKVSFMLRWNLMVFVWYAPGAKNASTGTPFLESSANSTVAGYEPSLVSPLLGMIGLAALSAPSKFFQFSTLLKLVLHFSALNTNVFAWVIATRAASTQIFIMMIVTMWWPSCTSFLQHSSKFSTRSGTSS